MIYTETNLVQICSTFSLSPEIKTKSKRLSTHSLLGTALKYIEITLTKSYFSKVRCLFSKESYNNWFITHDVDVGDNDDLDGGDGGDGGRW